MIFKRILVPYEESRPSKEALVKAIELAKATEMTRTFGESRAKHTLTTEQNGSV